MRTVIAVVVGITLLAALIVTAVVASGGGHGTASTGSFDLPALGGPGRVELSTYRGEPVVVTLFASWCAACQGELPEYAAAAKQLRGRVQFIGVDSQETGNGAAFAARFHLVPSGFVLASDVDQDTTGGLYTAYRAHGLPLTAFYSRTGQLLSTTNAAIPPRTLDQQIEQYYGINAS